MLSEDYYKGREESFRRDMARLAKASFVGNINVLKEEDIIFIAEVLGRINMLEKPGMEYFNLFEDIQKLAAILTDTRVACPNCSKEILINREFQGKCPHCGMGIVAST